MTNTYSHLIYRVLRIACAMCFIGHGFFGVITKPVWLNYFGVFGIGKAAGWHLMPVVGAVDIIMGIMILFYPMRGIVIWLIFWGLMTASLRPLSGEHFAELIERAGNFGAPLALLVVSAPGGWKPSQWLQPLKAKSFTNEADITRLMMLLRIIAFLLLAGHGWLNLTGKHGLLAQYESLGFTSPGTIAQIAGSFEIAAACLILLRPVRSLVLLICCWKIVSEFFYPHWGIAEWIERGGSYGTILALWIGMTAMAGSKPVQETEHRIAHHTFSFSKSNHHKPQNHS